MIIFQIPNCDIGESDPRQPSAEGLTHILWTGISGNGAKESVLIKEFTGRLGLGVARFGNHWLCKIQMSGHQHPKNALP